MGESRRPSIQERGDRPSRRRVPAGLLGALLLIVLAEGAIERHPLEALGGSQWSYRASARAAADDARRCQVLAFGDSLLKLGLAPRVVEAESGLRGYNLAVAGGQPAGSYFLLRRALAAGARPRAIVVDFFPSMLATSPHFNDDNLPLLLDLGGALDVARALGEPEEFARLAVPHLLPSVRSRAALRLDAWAALNVPAAQDRVELVRAIRNWRINRGAEITPSRPNGAYDLDFWERGFFGEFRCLPPNLAYLERFLDLADRHAIPVFWVLPPYQPALQERCERSGFDARHEAFVRARQADHPDLVVLDGRRSGYEAGVFVDWHHLGTVGAAAFSAEVGRAIRRHLDRPGPRSRWTALAAFRPPTGPIPLEDADQSRVVVRRELERGRDLRTIR